MKNMRSLLYATLCLIILTILVSLILSFLYFFNFFVGILSILTKVSGFIIWMIVGYLLGRNIKERTFFYALGFTIVLFALYLFFFNISPFNLFFLVLKCIFFVLSALIGRNK